MNNGRFELVKRGVLTTSVVVTAEQLCAEDWDDVLAIVKWCRAEKVVEHDTFLRFAPLAILYVGGAWAFDRDWVVRSVDGRFWVVDIEDFGERYRQYEPESSRG